MQLSKSRLIVKVFALFSSETNIRKADVSEQVTAKREPTCTISFLQIIFPLIQNQKCSFLKKKEQCTKGKYEKLNLSFIQ